MFFFGVDPGRLRTPAGYRCALGYAGELRAQWNDVIVVINVPYVVPRDVCCGIDWCHMWCSWYIMCIHVPCCAAMWSESILAGRVWGSPSNVFQVASEKVVERKQYHQAHPWKLQENSLDMELMELVDYLTKCDKGIQLCTNVYKSDFVNAGCRKMQSCGAAWRQRLNWFTLLRHVLEQQKALSTNFVCPQTSLPVLVLSSKRHWGRWRARRLGGVYSGVSERVTITLQLFDLWFLWLIWLFEAFDAERMATGNQSMPVRQVTDFSQAPVVDKCSHDVSDCENVSRRSGEFTVSLMPRDQEKISSKVQTTKISWKSIWKQLN